MLTDFQKGLIEKHTIACERNGFEYVGKSRDKGTYIKCRCLVCERINEFRSDNLRNDNVRCGTCLLNQYKEECERNGFQYIDRYYKKRTYIKAKCLDCEGIMDFDSGNLRKNSIKCKCDKKVFVKGFIYKLTIGPYYYIGLTDTTIRTRYAGHKKSCFNRSKQTYKSKKYRIIREQLCRILKKSVGQLTKQDFEDHVKVSQVAVVKTSRADLKALESMLINLDNELCINSIY